VQQSKPLGVEAVEPAYRSDVLIDDSWHGRPSAPVTSEPSRA
jgi:hypothetical protein